MRLRTGRSLKITRSQIGETPRSPRRRASALSVPHRGGISTTRRPNYWSSPCGLIPLNGTNRADKTFQSAQRPPDIYWSHIRKGSRLLSRVVLDYKLAGPRAANYPISGAGFVTRCKDLAIFDVIIIIFTSWHSPRLNRLYVMDDGSPPGSKLLPRSSWTVRPSLSRDPGLLSSAQFQDTLEFIKLADDSRESVFRDIRRVIKYHYEGIIVYPWRGYQMF